MTLLVFAPPEARYLRHLGKLPAELRILTGTAQEVFRADACAEAEVVLTTGNHGVLLKELWPQFRTLRWIHSLSAGLESMLFPELVASPVPLTNSRGVFARSLGEFALAGMLWFAKDLNRMRRQQAERRWEHFDVEELRGRTLGVVGYGSIGRETAARAAAFGMNVVTFRRCDGPGVLPAVLAASDYLLVAAPLTPQTLGLLGPRELAQLKPGAVVINLGRGPVIDETALLAALTERKIRGAVLDVYNTEPLPPDHPFWSLDNVLLSPHCADHTATWMDEAMDLFLRNWDCWTSGRPLENIADKGSGY